MRCYIQISLLPDEAGGVTLSVVCSNVFNLLHQAFVKIKDESGLISVGISFPEYNESSTTLGKIIRLHGEKEILSRLNLRDFFGGLQDYTHLTGIRKIPEKRIKGFVSYCRVRHGHSKAKLIRRHMKRHGVDKVTAEQNYANYTRNNFPELPFVLLYSRSTGYQKYPLYIKQNFIEGPGKGLFNTLGISPESGVEVF